MTLDREAAERALGSLASELGLALEEAAAGVVRVANTGMVQAVRVVTVERGSTVRGPVPGGAWRGRPASRRRHRRGARNDQVVAPTASGVLSALGLVVSERRRDLVESVLLSGNELSRERVAEVVERLGGRGREELGEPDAELRATYDLRYTGQAFELSVDGDREPDPVRAAARFRPRPRRALRLRRPRRGAGADRTAATWMPSRPGGAGARRGARGSRSLLFGGQRLERRLRSRRARGRGSSWSSYHGSPPCAPGWTAAGGLDAVVLER